MAGNDHRGSYAGRPSGSARPVDDRGVWQPQIGASGGEWPIGSREPGTPLPQDVGTSGWFNPSGYGSGFGAGGSEARAPVHAGSYGAARDPNRPRGPRNYRRSDERLRELISERLIDDPYIDSTDVSVTVAGGEVTLEGTVEDRREKYAIEELVDGIHGVRDVDNRLKVRRGFLSGLFQRDDGGAHRDGGDVREADRDGWTTAGSASSEGPASTQQEGSQGGRHQYGRPT